jgi:hypothetical protein
MAAKCYGVLRGRRMRVTRLDECGVPIPGAGNEVTSKGFIKCDVSSEVEDGDDYTTKNAAGELCINESGDPQLKWLTTSIDFCNVDPELFGLMTGMPLVMDGDAENPSAIGFSVDEDTFATVAFALEIWTDVAGQTCGTGGKTYGYALFPYNVQGALGDLTIENGAATFTIASRTHRDSGWGIGPYEVVNVAGEPSHLLTPIRPGEHMRQFLTDVAPPADACGAGTVPALPEITGLTVEPASVDLTTS